MKNILIKTVIVLLFSIFSMSAYATDYSEGLIDGVWWVLFEKEFYIPLIVMVGIWWLTIRG